MKKVAKTPKCTSLISISKQFRAHGNSYIVASGNR